MPIAPAPTITLSSLRIVCSSRCLCCFLPPRILASRDLWTLGCDSSGIPELLITSMLNADRWSLFRGAMSAIALGKENSKLLLPGIHSFPLISLFTGSGPKKVCKLCARLQYLLISMSQKDPNLRYLARLFLLRRFLWPC